MRKAAEMLQGDSPHSAANCLRLVVEYQLELGMLFCPFFSLSILFHDFVTLSGMYVEAAHTAQAVCDLAGSTSRKLKVGKKGLGLLERNSHFIDGIYYIPKENIVHFNFGHIDVHAQELLSQCNGSGKCSSHFLASIYSWCVFFHSCDMQFTMVLFHHIDIAFWNIFLTLFSSREKPLRPKK
jgi:hypothetical protein